MSIYAIVKNNRVVEGPVSTPSRWNGIGGFHRLSLEELKTHGWYPCVSINEQFNPRFQIRSLISKVFDPETEIVTFTHQVNDKPLQTVQREFIQEINESTDAALGQLVASYPEREVFSWATQEAEARAWVENNTHPTPLIDAISTARGLTKETLVTKVIEKSDLFALAAGTLLGIRQAKEFFVENAAIEDLYDFDTTVQLPQAPPAP